MMSFCHTNLIIFPYFIGNCPATDKSIPNCVLSNEVYVQFSDEKYYFIKIDFNEIDFCLK